MFSRAYSARKDNKVVKLPGPATIGNAIGNTVAISRLDSSCLNKLTPSTISRAIKKSIKDPATANSFTLIPIRFRISSPINKKIISTNAAITEALPLLIVPFFSRKEIMIGILPTISITANNTIVAVAISLKLKPITNVFRVQN